MKITREKVIELFQYDSETGEFYHAIDKNHGQFAKGSMVTGIDSNGYRILRVNGKRYKGHQIAWLIYYGEWPSNHIDHANGDPSDNRICNLRLADWYKNNQNQGVRSDNTSGIKGLSICEGRNKKYRAQVNAQGVAYKQDFYDFDEAVEWLRVTRLEKHGEFARFE